jgi:hypothetical protein
MSSFLDFLKSFPKRSDVTPEELAARRKGYANLYQGSLLARNRDQTPLSVRGAEEAQDFIPVVGDVLALGEAGGALSRGELAAAGLLGAGAIVGLVPGAGDVVAKPIMAAGRKAADVAKSPAQKVADLLASGRADEVTDEMLGKLTPNDNAELLELYQSGATGMDLPMDEASRMARASEQGYAGDYFHGSNLDFPGFDNSTRGTFLTNSPAVADSYVAKDGGTIYPALVRGGSDFPVVEGGGRFYSDIPQSALPEELEFMKYDIGSDIPLITDNVVSRARDERLPGVIFEDIIDRGPNLKQYRGETDLMAQDRTRQAAVPSDVINTLDPSRVRSKFARFDPRLSNLKNLSAAAASIPGGLLALQEMQKRANEEQQRQGLLQ